jgi:acetoacetyl-CoA synthetase
MPSMPVFFWNDPEFERYNESYFEMYPGIWRHGDWTTITERDGVIISGRSDATLNRGGIRIGTAEIYRVLDKMDEVQDALIVCVDKKDGSFYMPLFVVSDNVINDSMKNKIKKNIRLQCTPRHVPDEIISIKEVPYTISGKKTEAPVKKILMGENIDQLLNKDALKNPQSLNFFIDLAGKLD